MGKVHGSLARAGKVKGQIPMLPSGSDHPKRLTGRASKRIKYTRRILNGEACNRQKMTSSFLFFIFYCCGVVSSASRRVTKDGKGKLTSGG